MTFFQSNHFPSATPTATATGNLNKDDIEVQSCPDDTISCLRFSPATLSSTFLMAASWDSRVRLWEVMSNGQTVPKLQQSHQGPILDACWSPDGSKVFTCSVDKTAQMLDLATNQMTQIAQHDAPIKTINYIQAPGYTCVMTGSWDRTLKFWDTRQPQVMLTQQLPERVYCASAHYPVAVVGTAGRGVLIYNLDPQPTEFKRMESPLKFQSRCLTVFLDKQKQTPTGFVLGSIEGRVAIQYLNPTNPKDNFTFKCHRSNGTTGGYQDIYAVNEMAFHPVHGTMATVGSDGRYTFWDKDARTKLRSSELIDQPLTSCAFDAQGQIFAYAASYDWSKGHEGFDVNKKPKIYLRSCMDELKPTQRKT